LPVAIAKRIARVSCAYNGIGCEGLNEKICDIP